MTAERVTAEHVSAEQVTAEPFTVTASIRSYISPLPAGEFGQFMRLTATRPEGLAERRARIAEGNMAAAETVRLELRRRKLSQVEQRKREYEQRFKARSSPA